MPRPPAGRFVDTRRGGETFSDAQRSRALRAAYTEVADHTPARQKPFFTIRPDVLQ
ncbi:MAG: hypothetical protein WCH04_14915 [Gammaproteobacteria bacterium]